MDRTISASNLGPIEYFNFVFPGPGVHILNAPNGSGKSILLEATAAAAAGKGRLPLRDGTRKGEFRAFGAQITIGEACRHKGQFLVTHIEGRFDLARLVDPRKKDPEVADSDRVKSLVSLTGVEASLDLFRRHPAFPDFDSVVDPEDVDDTDLVVMAAKVKKAFDAAALAKEKEAEREKAHALTLMPPADLDLHEEHDEAALRVACDQARDNVTRLQQQAKLAKQHAEKHAAAAELVRSLGADKLAKQLSQTQAKISEATESIDARSKHIREIELQLERLKADNKNELSNVELLKVQVKQIQDQLNSVAEAQKALDAMPIVAPEQDDIDTANELLESAQKAVERGVLIRKAIADSATARKHRHSAESAIATAQLYRSSAQATDDVLSSSIKCRHLRIEDGRLVVDTERRKSVPYHELSDGEKWKIAIDIGADQVGANGMLVISQVGWEGIDGKHRLEIHHHAVRREIYILTAEASDDPDAPNEILVRSMESPANLVHTNIPPLPVTEAAKPPKAPAAKKRSKRQMPTDEEALSDDSLDDIF